MKPYALCRSYRSDVKRVELRERNRRGLTIGHVHHMPDGTWNASGIDGKTFATGFRTSTAAADAVLERETVLAPGQMPSDVYAEGRGVLR